MGKSKSFVNQINVAYLNFSEDGQYFLKVLIPSYAAGSIIGKGGQTIVQLQKETGATIKLSKSKDFYPGRWNNKQIICKSWGEHKHDVRVFHVLKSKRASATGGIIE